MNCTPVNSPVCSLRPGLVSTSRIAHSIYQASNSSEGTELSGKTRGGGISFYVNEGWCKDVTVLKKSCSPQVETIFINCKPFYSPWEFSSFFLIGVYIHPQACVSEALQHLADQITNMEQKHLDSLLIVLATNYQNSDSTLSVIPGIQTFWTIETQWTPIALFPVQLQDSLTTV